MSTMIAITGGSFQIGANRPNRLAKTITVGNFYLSDVAVSRAEWRDTRDLANANGYSIPSPGAADGANHPVQWVSPLDMAAWCNALSERLGRAPAYGVPGGGTYLGGHGVPRLTFDSLADGFRLPSEPEWEWAAREGGVRGGDEVAGDVNRWSSWPRTEDADGNITWTNGAPRTIQVDYGVANALGIYHQVGNVWEAVQHLVRDPRGEYDDDQASDTYTIVRGGCAISPDAVAIPYYREVQNVRNRSPWVGFRVARNG